MNLAGTVHLNKIGCCLLIGLFLIVAFYTFSNKNTLRIQTEADKINLRKLLKIAIIALEEGGKEIVNLRDKLRIESKGKTKEGANDLVTTADFKSHCNIINRLKQSFPTVNIVSEEKQITCHPSSFNSSVMSGFIWSVKLSDEWISEDNVKIWIDPLDATQEYTEKLYKYVTVMLCVAVEGKPTIGVIHKPFMKETWWGWVNKSCSLKFRKLPRNKNKRTFIISRSHAGAIEKIIKSAFPEGIEVIEAGGAGYKVLEVANNRADVYVHMTQIKKWDICAGNAILNTLGGRMSTKFNKEIDYADSNNVINEDGLIASLHDHKLYLKLL